MCIRERLQGGGGGGKYDGMDPWEQSVDRRLADLHSDQRDLLRAGLGAFVLAFGAIITSFFLLSAKIDGIGQQIADLKTDVAVLKATRSPQPNPFDQFDAPPPAK